jgi:hypothetical protein
LEKYHALVQRMEIYFKGFTIEYIERNKNTEADDLAKVIAHNIPMPLDVFYQVLEDASAKILLPEPKLINIIKGEDWRALIIAYLPIIMSQIAPLRKSECNSGPKPTN